jgi:protein CpxP
MCRLSVNPPDFDLGALVTWQQGVRASTLDHDFGKAASGIASRKPQDSPRRAVYRSVDEPTADARNDCGTFFADRRNMEDRMSRSRLLALALVGTLIGAGGIIQASADDSAPAAGWHHRHDRAAQPVDICQEHFARTAGRLAYTEAKLQLTPAQQPLWDKWQQAVTAGAKQERGDCLASLPHDGVRLTALDRDDRLQKKLALKVDSLKAARPALAALYESLTPEQRAIFDQPRPMGRHGGFGHHPRPEEAPL